MNRNSIDKKLDMIGNILLAITALLSFAVSGKNFAYALQDYYTSRYTYMAYDLIFAIWLFAMGVMNAKNALNYFITKHGR